MKTRFLFCATLCAVMALGSCRYDDNDIWKAVNKQEERISALEKWRSSVEKQLGALQGIITATDYVTGVEKVVKDGKNGYKVSFLHAEPITLYYNDDNEVSAGSNAQSISVAQDEKGYYWVHGTEPLMVDGKKVYVKGGDAPTLKPDPQKPETYILTIDGASVKIDPRVDGPHPIKGIEERDGKIVITLANNTTKELPMWMDFNSLFLSEYSNTTSGEKLHAVKLPEGFTMSLVGAVPAGWSFDVVGSGETTQIKVMYPASGEATVTFVIFADGKSVSAHKKLTFKVDAAPGIAWVNVVFDGQNPIQIPDDAEGVRVTSASPVAPMALNNNVCTPLKNSRTVKHIDLSGVNHTTAIPANAFFVNAVPSEPENQANFNTTIETIILPRGYNGNIFANAFKHCKALKSVTTYAQAGGIQTNIFDGCDALEHFYVPQEHVAAYQAKLPAIASKITAHP